MRIGDITRHDNNHNTELFEIEKIIKYPDYQNSAVDDDIVLFKLDRDIEFTEFIRPICLPQTDDEPEKAIATGWGLVEAFSDRQSATLMKVNLDIFNETECQPHYKNNRKVKKGIDYASKVCAGSQTERKDTCQGDSGMKIFQFS